jgi:hypothetical protein
MFVRPGRKERALFRCRLIWETEYSITVEDIGKNNGMQMPNVWRLSYVRCKNIARKVSLSGPALT